MSDNNDDMNHRRSSLVEFVFDVLKRKLVDYGVEEAVADQVACAAVDELTGQWGGQFITIPKDFIFRISLRDDQIFSEFTGRNQSQLARKFNLSVRAIYDIIRRVRRKGDPNQPRLF